MQTTADYQMLDTVNARTTLAGSNKMELLLFSLGTDEVFGINVFKVREVSGTPKVTPCPNMPAGVEGVISLRGNIIPVISLASMMRMTDVPENTGQTMIVTEFSRHTQAFLVHDVDRIIRVDWERIKPPEFMLSGQEGAITAITELDDGRLVSILDVEQILADVIGEPPVPEIGRAPAELDATIFFVDDSAIARKEIVMVLDKLGIRFQQASNGLEAWEKLQGAAGRAVNEGLALREQIRLILVDAEMPEMDGYVLTRNIKTDKRFEGIPVVMHSSLSSEANRVMGQKVGVDAYVAKFDPIVLADTVLSLLKK